MTTKQKKGRGAVKQTAKRRAYRARRRERERAAELVALSAEAAVLVTGNFAGPYVARADAFIRKVEPVLRRLAQATEVEAP